MEISQLGGKVLQATTTPVQKTVTEKVDASIKQTFEHENSGQNKKQLETVVEGVNDFLLPMHVAVRFELHDKLNEYYVTLVDTATDEVIREIPPKKFLDMYASMTEYMGLFVDEKI